MYPHRLQYRARPTSEPTYQLLTLSLRFLPASDFNIYLIAGMFQFNLQGSYLRLAFSEDLFARSQFPFGVCPSAPTVIKVFRHLDEG